MDNLKVNVYMGDDEQGWAVELTVLSTYTNAKGELCVDVQAPKELTDGNQGTL